MLCENCQLLKKENLKLKSSLKELLQINKELAIVFNSLEAFEKKFNLQIEKMQLDITRSEKIEKLHMKFEEEKNLIFKSKNKRLRAENEELKTEIKKLKDEELFVLSPSKRGSNKSLNSSSLLMLPEENDKKL